MLEAMKALAREKRMCVLATTTGSKPHCSLMAYVTNAAGTEIYMATLKQTRKYGNLIANPAVSLLIDNRDSSPPSTVRAMTVEGRFRQIADPAKIKQVRQELVSHHPRLRGFLEHPGAEVIQIDIVSFLMLKGPTQATFVDVSEAVS